MRSPCSARERTILAVILVAIVVIGLAFSSVGSAFAAGACELVQSDRDPSLKVLQCGQDLTVRLAKDASYTPLYKKGKPLPVGVRLNGGALLIEFHPSPQQKDFQILTPLAVAAVRGTRWAMEVTAARTSTLVLEGSVAVTNRRLKQNVLLTDGQGVDITPTDTSMVPKQWGEARLRELLARFGE